jgi:hypothetical protein
MEDDKQHRPDDNGPTSGWNEFNELTLSVMANRTKYDKCKKTLANTSDALNELFRKEKMYYKERILNMTRDLFHEQCENDTMNDAHREYLKSCIEYLKWNDITDMIDNDKRNEIQEESHATADELFHARQELQEKIDATNIAHEDEIDDNDPQSEEEQEEEVMLSPPSYSKPGMMKDVMSIANKMCMRKKTIDDFIVLKPAINHTDEHINAKLPKVRDYHGEIMKRATTIDTINQPVSSPPPPSPLHLSRL